MQKCFRNIKIAVVLSLISISAFAQTMEISNTTVEPGTATIVEISMRGVGNFVSAGFIVTVPSGFSLSDYETAVSDHEVRMNLLEANSMKIALYSIKNAPFNNTGNDVIKLQIYAEGVAAGTYQGVISAVEFASSDAMLTKTADVTFSIKVAGQQYAPGDANGDGTITVADYIAIAHYIMGNPSSNFNEKAADANGDGQINVADYIAVAHIIMNTTSQ